MVCLRVLFCGELPNNTISDACDKYFLLNFSVTVHMCYQNYFLTITVIVVGLASEFCVLTLIILLIIALLDSSFSCLCDNLPLSIDLSSIYDYILVVF